METHFKGPKGEYRCIYNPAFQPGGWIVERLVDDKVYVVSMNMTRKDAFKHAREMSGLAELPDVTVRPDSGVRIVEPLPDRRGLVAHSRAKL